VEVLQGGREIDGAAMYTHKERCWYSDYTYTARSMQY
jgi:hypothetical protein